MPGSGLNADGDQPYDSYYTWDNYDSEWVIATWDEDEDYYQVVGSDEIFDWCNKHYMVVEVVPKLNPPTSSNKSNK